MKYLSLSDHEKVAIEIFDCFSSTETRDKFCEMVDYINIKDDVIIDDIKKIMWELIMVFANVSVDKELTS